MRWLDSITDSVEMHLSNFQETGEGQESLVYCSPWGHTESDMALQLNNNIKGEKTS